MKVIGVKNYAMRDGYQSTASLSFNEETQELTVIYSCVNPRIEDHSAPGYSFSNTAVVNFNELRARRDWCEHQVYFIALAEGKFLPLFGLYEETLPRRETAFEYANRLKRNLMVGINVPFADSTNDDVFITVNLNLEVADDALTVGPGLEKIWSEAAASGTERVLRLPHIRAVAPQTISPESTVTVEVRMEDAAGSLIERNATVYAETVSGISGGTRVQIVNGVGYLPVSSAGMPVGSVLRTKLGWKYYVGLEDVNITVA